MIKPFRPVIRYPKEAITGVHNSPHKSWQRDLPRGQFFGKDFVQWMHTDSEENYKKRGNHAFSPTDVGYHFNAHGFRSDPFDKVPGEYSVMFVGCSFTSGVGMPFDKLWTSLLTSQLSTEWGRPVRQFNLAHGGEGTDYCAMMVHQCAPILKPDAVFVAWSYAHRMTWHPSWHERTSLIPDLTNPDYYKEWESYIRLTNDTHAFYNMIRNMVLVENLLKHLDIPYYWATMNNFKRNELSPYVDVSGCVEDAWFKPIDYARDNAHYGIQSHADFAATFYNAVRGAIIPKG